MAMPALIRERDELSLKMRRRTQHEAVCNGIGRGHYQQQMYLI